jgi:subtilase family serine protease
MDSRDLIVSAATAPAAAVLGKTLEVSWSVTNQGDAAALADWYDYVYVSDDTTFDFSDTLVSSEFISVQTPLAAGGNYTVTQNLFLPNTTTGSRYLLFVVDGSNNQGEIDETNNVRAVPIQISTPDVDLVVSATAPASGNWGETIEYSWTVTNQGDETATPDWYDYVYLSSDATLDDTDLYLSFHWSGFQADLTADGSYTVTRNTSVPNTVSGSYYLLFAADRYNFQAETNDNNNVFAQPIEINAAELPDLVVSSGITPASATLGQSIEVSYTIANQGTGAATADWYDYIYLSDDATFDFSDTYVTSRQAGEQTPLVAGSSYAFTQSIIIPNYASTGSRYLLFVADGNNSQIEDNETNNTLARPIEITASSADLLVSATTVPASANVGETIAVSWTVTNQGSSEAVADWYDYVYISDDETFNFTDTYISSRWAGNQTPLVAGAGYTATQNIFIPNTTATGSRYLVFVADGSNSQRETNESNNVRAVPITLGSVDLAVSAATAPASANVGETVEVSWTVTNQGNAVASGDWYDYVYISDDAIFDFDDTYISDAEIVTQTPLAAGNSYTFTQNVTIPNAATGNQYLLFVADGDEEQGELNESNNTRAVPIQLGGPDLTVSAATAPVSGTLGESVELSWTVTNQGNVAATADWYDAIYISDDATFDFTDTFVTSTWTGAQTPLAAGASYSFTQNVTIPITATGDRYLLFVADKSPYYYDSNQQGETNENNNTRAVAINLSAPDLVVTDASNPTFAVLGQSVEVSWTVKNEGSVTALADWYDYIYISNDDVLDDSDTYISERWTGSDTPLVAGANYTATQNITIPNDVGTGSRYLLFATDKYYDDSGNQGETNENNNVLVKPIELGAPDLVVSAASTLASAAVLGQTASVSWTVTNQGSTDAPADWYDSIYISTDQTLDSSDTFVTSRWAGDNTPLAVGASYIANQDITIPITGTGNRYLLFVADNSPYYYYDSNQQGETNENNNVRAVPIQLSGPDLVVSNIVAPIEGLSGQQIDIAWTVTNQGSEDATGTWIDTIYLSSDQEPGQDQYFGDFSFTGTIAAGQSVVRQQTITLPVDLSGDHWVIVQTNADNQFAEAPTNNNTTVDDRAIDVRLSPLPNLQVSSVTAPPTAFSRQDAVIEWTVTNTGNGATSAPYWYDAVWLSLDNTLDNSDTFLGSVTNTSYLNVGESYVNSLTATLPQNIEGDYYFLVETDYYDQVFEFQNEGDNFQVGGPTDIEPSPVPDFQVTSVNAPAQAFSGQTMSLSYTITNEGEGIIPLSENEWYEYIYMSEDEVLDSNDRHIGTVYRDTYQVYTSYYYDSAGNLRSSTTVNDLPEYRPLPGQSYTATQNVALPVGVSGDFYFFVQIDATNQVFEGAFESNNTSYDTTATRVNLTPPPDLEVEMVDAPGEALASHELTINYRVTNFGATATPNSYWKDSFYLSTDNQLNIDTDLHLGDQFHNGVLEAGVSYDGSATFTIPDGVDGSYYVFVVTDKDNDVFELANDNNASFDAGSVVISSRPADLTVSAASTLQTVEAGKAVRVNWTVSNQGSGDTAIENWTDKVFASTDGVLDSNDILLGSFSHNGLLNAGASYSQSELVTLPFNLVGDYNLFIVTDTDGKVYEAANEGNNSSLALPVTVTRQTPDLQVTQINSPTTAQSGEPFTVSWTVQNLGTGRTNSNYWYDNVYLSLDSVISSDDIKLGQVYHSDALDPSAQYQASQTFTLPVDLAGQFYVLVGTDSTDQVIEGSLENNNQLATSGTTPITLSAVPDLVVQSVDAPATAIGGQLFPLTWTVQNNGANTDEHSWYDAFYLSRDQIFDRETDTFLGYQYHNGGLAAGQSYTTTQSFQVPRGLSGPYYVFAVTDSGNAIYERTGEQNNTSYDGNSMQVSLAPPADLVVDGITIPSTGVPGQDATISYTVTNQGANAALGSWYDSIYLSADNQWDVGDALFGRVYHSGDVAGGASYSETLTASLPGVVAGDYQVIIRSDIRNQIPEANEANNTGASANLIALDAERLELGVQTTGTLGQNQSVYYRIDVASGDINAGEI